MKLRKLTIRTAFAIAVPFLAVPGLHAAILVNPVITNSATAYNGSYLASNILDGLQNTEYASQSQGNNTFIDFDFGSAVTMDRFVQINRPGDVVTGASLILSNNADFSSPVASIPLTNPAGGNAGSIVSLGGSYTARYAKWDVTSFSGSNNLGGQEIAFLNTPSGLSSITPTVITGSTAYSGYSLTNITDGVLGPNGADQYASAGAGANTAVTFEFASAINLGGFDFFDRGLAAERTTAFSLTMFDESGVQIGSALNYTKGSSWTLSESALNIAGVKKIVYDVTTSADANPGIMEMNFYSVPEPSAALLGGLGLLGLLRRRRC